MLNYDQANELKQKGFPQRGWGFRACEHNKEALKHVQRCDCQMVDLVSVPSLGELIGQCGKEFHYLEFLPMRNNGEWYAQLHDNTKPCGGYGATPDEAVANAWLKCKLKH